MSESSFDYSIVICAYNSDPRLLGRCLDAIYNINTVGLKVETILVDNNSPVPLNTVPYIQDYLNKIDGMKIILVKEQGHTFARIGGVKEAQGKHIVFFDDDNEADVDYLIELDKLCKKYSHVTAWGPGNIWVDFIDGIDPSLEEYGRSVFQERHEPYMAYSNIRTWQSCYPFGTGMAVQASFLKAYVKLQEEGFFTLPGRRGNLLSCGEDVQIVLYCLREGGSAGVAPELKLKHIIPAKRANVGYINRLLYGAYVCGSKSILEVFPEHREVLERSFLSASKLERRAFKKYFKLFFKGDIYKTFDFVSYLGNHCGIYDALKRPVPKRINWLIKKLKLA
jgi:glycosyltransferase involved in cell wall biosynthesis